MLPALPLENTPFRPVLGALYAYIASVSAVGFAHPKLRRPEARRIRQAINSWWPTAFVLTVATLGGTAVGMVVFAGVSAWALVEYLRLLPADDRPAHVSALAIACVPLHYAALMSGRSELAGGAVVLAWGFIVIPLARAFVGGPDRFVDGSARVGFGLVVTVYALSFAPRLLLLPDRVGPAGGAGMLCFLLLTIMMGDANQWVFGKAFGRHRMAPLLSPNKTWEGFAGGVLVAALTGAWVGPRVTPLSPFAAAVAGAVLCGLGVLGDLLISALKRDLGVKDTGAVLPGQGGVLDRADSLLIAAPAFYYACLAWTR